MTKLIKEERQELLQKHKKEKNKKKADRVKTILLLDEGFKYEQISKVLFLSEVTIREYEHIYEKEGLESLLNLKYCGKTKFLTNEQEQELSKYLEETTYSKAEEICQYVKEKYQVQYKPKSMVKLLKRLKFVYKKTKQIPGKADPVKQEEFIKKYKEIKEEMDPDDKIYFIDGCHPQHNSKPAYGWIKKGTEKELKTNTGRQRINLNGAIDINGEEVDLIIREDQTINAQSTIQLFQEIERKNLKARIIYIISDNARYYYNKEVIEYLKTSKIKIIFLPPYSPNLNLIERLWKLMYENVLNNKYYETFDEFKYNVMMFFKNINLFNDKVKSRLTENFQIIRKNF